METEALVIGAGPVGAAAAWRLATHGIGVTCVEQGEWFPTDCPQPDSPRYSELMHDKLHTNPNVRSEPADIAIDDEDSAIKPAFGNNVGGSSLYWAAHAPRFRPDDFTVHDTDSVAENWPLRYADLMPYYSLNEAMTGVAYVAGDPTIPARMPSAQRYPSTCEATTWIAGALKSKNWHAWPTDIVAGRPTKHCVHEGPCNIGCATRRASGADRNYLPAAMSRGARLLTGTRIVALEHGEDGRITAAVAECDGGRFAIRAQKYILAANGLHTPHLLLLSSSGRFPNGLANGTGLVGRRLMLHPYAWVDAVFAAPFARPRPGQNGGIISLQFRSSQSAGEHVRGSRLQFSAQPSSRLAVETLAASASLTQENAANHIVGFSICAEDLPEQRNRITLSDRITDSAGRPVPRMVYDVSENSRAILDKTMDRVAALFSDVGAVSTFRTPLKEQAGFHVMGTAVMGCDPQTSVTDEWGRCHQVENLFIADASVFVTSSTMNPTATAQALALRQADRICLNRK